MYDAEANAWLPMQAYYWRVAGDLDPEAVWRNSLRALVAGMAPARRRRR